MKIPKLFGTYVTIGFPLLVLGMAIFAGGLINATVILIGSIVCTAGVGLIVWLPLAAASGWIAYSLTKWGLQVVGIVSPADGGNAPVASAIAPSLGQMAATVEQIALDDYIRRALALNYPYERIAAPLKSQGWSDTEIRQSYQKLRDYLRSD